MSASSLERLKSLLLQNSQELNSQFIHSLDFKRDSEKAPAWKSVLRDIETGYLNPLDISDGQRKQIEFLERCFLDFLRNYQEEETSNSIQILEEKLYQELDRAEMLVSQGFVKRALRLIDGIDIKALEVGLLALALKVRQIEVKALNLSGQSDRLTASFSDILLIEKQQLQFKCIIHKSNRLISLLGCGTNCEILNLHRELKEELQQLKKQTGWRFLDLLDSLLEMFSMYLENSSWDEGFEGIYEELQRESAVLVKWGLFTKASRLELMFAQFATLYRNDTSLFFLLKKLSSHSYVAASEQFEYCILNLDYFILSKNYSELQLFMLKFNEWLSLNRALFNYEEEKIRAYRFIVYSLIDDYEKALKNLESCIRITKSVRSRHLMYRFLKVAFLLENGHLEMAHSYITATLKYLSRNKVTVNDQNWAVHLRVLGNSIESPEVVLHFHEVCQELCRQNGAVLMMDFSHKNTLDQISENRHV